MTPKPPRKLVICFIFIWMAAQIILPFRHFLIEGDANWTEEGQDFSWRMMLRAKMAGQIIYTIKDVELVIVRAQGKPRIQWKSWFPNEPRAVYAPVDCRLFDWNKHPGLTVTYEPLVGYRVILNSSGAETARDQIIEKWQKTYGRSPQIDETVSLEEVIVQLITLFESLDKNSKFIADLETLKQSIASLDQTASLSREKTYAHAVETLERIKRSPFWEAARPVLMRLRPFALQGGASTNHPLWVIQDKNLDFESSKNEFYQLTDGEPYWIWVDLSRMPPYSWKRLPLTFITYHHRKLKVLWNYFRELNGIQVERFSINPHMVHQYAQRVARVWKQKTGRQPEIYVSSYVILNDKRPQLLVDPKLNLVTAKYKPFGHNPWVLPIDK